MGWSIVGELGWLVTACTVAVQLAAAAIASSTTLGMAVRARKPGQRFGATAASRTGNASTTSGCTATAAPASQADRPGFASARATMA